MEFIKSLCMYLLTFLFLSTSLEAFSDECYEQHPTEQTEQKIYLKKEMLHITDEGIFLIAGHEVLQIGNIRMDSNGIYTTETAFGMGWQCKCGYLNGESFNTCQSCGRRRP